MKTGTSFLDRNNIKDFVVAGNLSAQEVSERLNIKVEVVQRVIDSFTTRGQKAAATRAANKAAKEAAE